MQLTGKHWLGFCLQPMAIRHEASCQPSLVGWVAEVVPSLQLPAHAPTGSWMRSLWATFADLSTRVCLMSMKGVHGQSPDHAAEPRTLLSLRGLCCGPGEQALADILEDEHAHRRAGIVPQHAAGSR